MAKKAQAIRIIDVWGIGPGIIWLSSMARKSARTPVQTFGINLMVIVGYATIVYNGLNYLDEKGNQ